VVWSFQHHSPLRELAVSSFRSIYGSGHREVLPQRWGGENRFGGLAATTRINSTIVRLHPVRSVLCFTKVQHRCLL
jgi:hypothetical protein